MLPNAQIITYDTQAFPFARVLAQVFKVDDIARLHVSEAALYPRPLNYNDNVRLRTIMQNLPLDAAFYKLYHAWMAKVLVPVFGQRISYSAHPKMRVHLAGTGSVSKWHRDVEVTHRPDQINCYLPFTDVFDSNTLYVETDYYNQDFQPVNLRYGEALLWDGGYLEHGTVRNETDHTRVSCDFRFVVNNYEQTVFPWNSILAGRREKVG